MIGACREVTLIYCDIDGTIPKGMTRVVSIISTTSSIGGPILVRQ